MNSSELKCCICNNKESGEFIIYNDKKYHLECIEDLVEDILPGLNNRIDELEAEIKEDNDDIEWWHNRFHAVQRNYENSKTVIKEVKEKIESVQILGLREGKTLIATLLNDVLSIIEKVEGKEEEK